MLIDYSMMVSNSLIVFSQCAAVVGWFSFQKPEMISLTVVQLAYVAAREF